MKFDFPKCQICGSFGHLERRCAVRDLNNQQESLFATSYWQNATHAARSLGLTPALEAEILSIRASWFLKCKRAAVQSAC